jgi:hypothetical protein
VSHRPSDRSDKHRSSKKPAYPVARPVNPPAGQQRPMAQPAPQAKPASPKPNNLAFSVDDPPVPEFARKKGPSFLKKVGAAALVLFIISLGVGTVAFALTYKKGRKHHVDPNAVAKMDTKETDSDKKPEKKPEVSEKKPEEKKPEEKKKPETSEDKKPAEKKPAEKKPEEKKPAEKMEDKKPAEKKPEEKKPEEKKPAEKMEDKKPAVDPKFASIIYEKDISPIFKAKCVFCHDNKKTKGGFNMTTMELILKGGNTGPGLVRGKPEKSELWTQIEGDLMPKNEPLTKEEKEKIKNWILGGARDAAMAAK